MCAQHLEKPCAVHAVGPLHQAGLLTWLRSPVAAFPISQWPMATRVHLTALGTSRSFTAFPILPPQGRHLMQALSRGKREEARQSRVICQLMPEPSTPLPHSPCTMEDI